MPPLDRNKRTETRTCKCGCGETLLRWRLKLRDGEPNGYAERQCIVGHSRKNKVTSAIHREKISAAQKGQKRGSSWNKGVSAWWAKGENNVHWKGGVTPENTRLRNSPLTIEWRNAIYQLFDYTCQMCGAKCGNGERVILNAHHIKTWAEYPELRWDISNGVCLCCTCHDQTKGREREFESFFTALIENRVNSGEAQTDDAVGNPEPSLPNGIEVGRKVQRLTGEEPTDKPDTSARHESDDIVCSAQRRADV